MNGNSIGEDNLGESKQGKQIFSRTRNRWYTNEEVASILTNFNSHPEWQTNELQVRPKSGAVLLYSREKVRYRQDGYCWKKRKNGRTTREDHMKLKVQGIECIYGCYVHSAILPTFHRRCYWLLENPDIVLVHYLNQPPDDQNEMILTFNSNALLADTRRSWTNEEIIQEIGSVFGGISHIHPTLNINFPASQNANIDVIMQKQPYQSPISSQQTNEAPEQSMINEDKTSKAIASSIDATSHNHGQHNDKTSLHGVDSQRTYEDRSQQKQNEEIQNCDKAPVIDDDLKTFNDSSVSLNDRTTPMNEGVRDPLMDQSSCSPVTQIYNKIVDDIETYALPIEPNEYDHHHHHHHHHDHGIQSMDLVDSSLNEDPSNSPSNLGQNGVSITPKQEAPDMLTNSRIGQQEIGNQNSLPVGSIEQRRGTDFDELELNHDQSDCSAADLVTCDLFGEMDHDDVVNHHGGVVNGHDNDDMILSDFNLPGSENVSAHMNDHTLQQNSNSDHDDIRSLMMGISCPDSVNNGTVVGGTSNLLMDAGCSMDLFNFKTFSFEQKHHHNRLEVKSTTSETDTLSRLSPLASLVPRCNSTDNAIQSTLQRMDHQHSQYQQHHLSQNYIEGGSQVLALDDSFQNFHHQANNILYNNQHDGDSRNKLVNNSQYKSVTTSTNPSNNSTSCSPSPSSSSLFTSGFSSANGGTDSNHQTSDAGGHRSASGSNDLDRAQHQHYSSCSTNSTFMKLPLQQRQHSEQKEPSNSVLNSLLPKALSLDGSELSTTGFQYNPILGQRGQGEEHKIAQQALNHDHNLGNLVTSPLVGSHVGSSQQYEPSVLNQHNQNLLVSTSGDNNGLHQHQQQQQQQQHCNNGQQQISLTPEHVCGQRSMNSRNHMFQRPSVPSLSSNIGDGLGVNFQSDQSTNRNFLAINQNRSSSIGAQGAGQLNLLQHFGSNTMEYSRIQHQSITVNSRLLPILDYVPNWALRAGGTKVLIIGDWSNIIGHIDGGSPSLLSLNNNPNKIHAHLFSDDMRQMHGSDDMFYVIFGETLVPATLIQSNILRCYSPNHRPGSIGLKVVYRSTIVSEQVLFEIRDNVPVESVEQMSQNGKELEIVRS